MLTLHRVLRSPRLPSLPAAAVRLLELSREPNASTNAFVKVVESDPAIAAKILKLSNSSFFAFRTPVASVQRAVVLLGLNTITSMALSFSVARQSVGKGPLAEHFHRYWQQSVLQATAGEVLSTRVKNGDRSELFLLGLMLDIGQLAMLCTGGSSYGPVLEDSQETGQPLFELERDAFDFDHQLVGRELCRAWQFPGELTELVGRHHDDAMVEQPGPNDDATPPAPSTADDGQRHVTRLIAAIGTYFFPSAGCSEAAAVARDEVLACGERLPGLDAAGVDRLLGDVADRFRDNAELFDADPDDLPDPAEIMAMVNERLATQAVEAARAQDAVEQDKRRVERQKEEVEKAREQAERQKAELEEENKRLHERAIADPLTGLFNRQFFDETLASEIDMCQRTGKPLGLLFLDVDRFKSINDRFGHPFGDEVLAAVAEMLKAHVRKSDVVARYGGEEFVLLARQPSESGLRTLAERIREAVESLRLEFAGAVDMPEAEPQRVPVTISIGASHAIPRRVESTLGERLVSEADAAMYEAKRGGRNRVVLRSLLSDEQRAMANMITMRRFSFWLVKRGIVDVAGAMQAFNSCLPPGERIGELAEEFGLLDRGQVDEVLAAQIEGNMGQRFGELAIQRGFLDTPRVAALLALQTESPTRIAKALIREGVLDPQRAAELHEEYLAEVVPELHTAGV